MDEETLSEAFWAVTRRLRHRTKTAFEPWDLSPSLARGLNVLARGGDLRLSALAERLGIAPRSATEVADELTRRGLAERLPDPDDRRATRLTLTTAGAEAAEAIRAARHAESERFFSALTPADRDDLARLLRKLRDDPH